MIEYVFEAILIVGASIGAFKLGRLSVRKSDEHKHIWDVWEHCELRTYEWFDGKKTPVMAKGQKRDCLSCGERQVREVVT